MEPRLNGRRKSPTGPGPVQVLNPFALTPDSLSANASRWASAHLDGGSPMAAGAGFRLVHRAPTERLATLLRTGVIRSARALRERDPDHPVRTFAMDAALDLDAAVFFTPGFVTQDSSHRLGAAIVLSAEASARVLAAPTTRWVAQDLADVLKLFRCRAPDVSGRSERFERAVRVYLGHAFTGADGAALQRAAIDRDHGGDEADWRRWIAQRHAGRGFDHICGEVERCWADRGSLPMTPEVIVPGAYDLADDPGFEVIEAGPDGFTMPA